MSSTNTPRRDWFKSSFSASSNNCVEVAFDGDMVLVRDDKYDGPADLQPTIAVPVTAWAAFLKVTLGADIQAGSIAVPSIATDSHGTVVRDAVGTALEFTPAEWTAFVAGIRAGEFIPASV
ncbi:DUF397 domain-containing protein (plasmid) [Nocardia sp. CA-084685]|uniref:DUF397 domain-containing protein n=1 Tax=Nocardia sp. CA-084685 TaxID=3239970 RepID=UPI003D98A14C